jgi:enamine deaminase RidA (YjgF/YER057c/UK114 family)
MAAAAKLRGIAGLVITGGVRDSQQLVAVDFPTFAGCVSIRGTGKDPRGAGQIGEPVTIGDVTISAGDMVFGDADGVVVLPAGSADLIIEKARARDRDEDAIVQRLRAGETTLSIYGLPDISPDRRNPVPQRRSVDVEGLSHGALPIPVASRVGQVIATGGIRGVDPTTGIMPADVGEQASLMFDNLRRAVEAAGASVDNILKITIWIATPDARVALNPPWLALFPDPASRPARHILSYDLPGGMLVQCDALAVVP